MSSRVNLNVADERGQPCPCRVDVYAPGAGVKRFWSGSGKHDFETSSGKLKVIVRRGIHYDAASFELDAQAGAAISRDVTLRQRFDPRALGWYGGENHLHGQHDKKDAPRTFEVAAEMAAADGLDYLQVAWAWEPTFSWVPHAQLDAQCRAVSRPDVVIGWNIEAPKAYMSEDDGGESGNLHCFGHGWTVNLKDNSLGRDFFYSGPAFNVLKEVARQGGVIGCAHPVRSSFHKGNFVSNWASELPFDFVAGAPYAAVDILNDSPLLFFESERFWYTLLNLGYKVSGTGNSDGALSSNAGLGRFRTYTKIDGAFSWAKLAEGLSAGKCVASSGPFVLFEVDGQPPGAEFPSDGRVRRATIKAWSAPLPGETLTAVQLVRNGEIVRAWDLRTDNAREWQTSFELCDDEFAWYCVRALSSCRDPRSQMLWGPQVYELAVANPVFFLPAGFARPQPEPARVALTVIDAATGQGIAASVQVLDAGAEVARAEVPASGEWALTTPATASLKISARGYTSAERNLYMDCSELFEYCRNMGTVWPSFFSPETYRELRQRLGRLKLRVALKATA